MNEKSLLRVIKQVMNNKLVKLYPKIFCLDIQTAYFILKKFNFYYVKQNNLKIHNSS
jgi:hypothetical protein